MPKNEMDFKAADSKGITPDLGIIGRKYRHQNGQQYIVGGWSYDADRNRWMIGYKAAGGVVVFMRLPEEFFGMKGKAPRFIQEQ